MQSTFMSWVLKDLGDTRKLGAELATKLPSTSILLLQGELGAGKTSCVQGIAMGLGIDEQITSPTFALSQHYLGDQAALIHIDLYRLENSKDAKLLFFQEEEEAKAIKAIIAIEWPERLDLSLPEAWRLTLSYRNEGGRTAQLMEPEKESRN